MYSFVVAYASLDKKAFIDCYSNSKKNLKKEIKKKAVLSNYVSAIFGQQKGFALSPRERHLNH